MEQENTQNELEQDCRSKRQIRKEQKALQRSLILEQKQAKKLEKQEKKKQKKELKRLRK